MHRPKVANSHSPVPAAPPAATAASLALAATQGAASAEHKDDLVPK